MKKLLAATLALGVGLTSFAGINALAAGRTENIPVTGYIGVDNEDESQLPEGFIDIEVPERLNWAVTAQSGGRVLSPKWEIINHSNYATFNVAFVSYNQTNSATFPGDLTLHLTDDLALENILEAERSEFSTLLASKSDATDAGDKSNIWTFGFDGQYTGYLPGTSVTPTYNLTLHFEVDSFEILDANN